MKPLAIVGILAIIALVIGVLILVITVIVSLIVPSGAVYS